VLACVSAARADADPQAAPGRVYVDGVELAPPFTFTGVGTDTLYLNGRPYAVFGPLDAGAASIEVPAAHLERFAFADSAWTLIKRAEPSDRLALLASIYRDSPLVLEVQEYESWLRVRWASDPDEWEETNVPTEDIEPLDVMTCQQTLMNQFYATVERCGLFAFGTQPRNHYHFTMPRTAMPQFDRILAGIKAGESLNPAAVGLSPQFLEDLTRSQNGER